MRTSNASSNLARAARAVGTYGAGLNTKKKEKEALFLKIAYVVNYGDLDSY